MIDSTFRALCAASLLIAAGTPAFAEHPGSPDRERSRLEQAERSIQEAVKAGKISEAEADKKRAAMRKAVRAHAERGEMERWEGIKRRIEGAVERGDLSREEADRKYVEIKKEFAAQREHQERRRHEEDHHHRERREHHGEKAELHEAIVRGVHAAVELGHIDDDEAREWILRLTGQEDEHTRRLNEVMKRGIRAAVELGTLDEEEAEEIIEELQHGHEDDDHEEEEEEEEDRRERRRRDR